VFNDTFNDISVIS